MDNDILSGFTLDESSYDPNDYITGRTTGQIFNDARFLSDLRKWYESKGQTFDSKEDALKEFYDDFQFRDINTVGNATAIYETQTLDKDSLQRMSRLQRVYNEMPLPWQDGGASDQFGALSTTGTIAKNIILDPTNLIGFGAGGVAARGALGAKMAGRGIEGVAGKAIASTAAKEAALNAGINAASSVATQNRDIDLGLQDEFSWGQMGVEAGLGAGLGGAIGGITSYFAAKHGIKIGEDIAAQLIERGVTKSELDKLTPKQISALISNPAEGINKLHTSQMQADDAAMTAAMRKAGVTPQDMADLADTDPIEYQTIMDMARSSPEHAMQRAASNLAGRAAREAEAAQRAAMDEAARESETPGYAQDAAGKSVSALAPNEDLIDLERHYSEILTGTIADTGRGTPEYESAVQDLSFVRTLLTMSRSIARRKEAIINLDAADGQKAFNQARKEHAVLIDLEGRLKELQHKFESGAGDTEALQVEAEGLAAEMRQADADAAAQQAAQAEAGEAAPAAEAPAPKKTKTKKAKAPAPEAATAPEAAPIPEAAPAPEAAAVTTPLPADPAAQPAAAAAPLPEVAPTAEPPATAAKTEPVSVDKFPRARQILKDNGVDIGSTNGKRAVAKAVREVLASIDMPLKRGFTAEQILSAVEKADPEVLEQLRPIHSSMRLAIKEIEETGQKIAPEMRQEFYTTALEAVDLPADRKATAIELIGMLESRVNVTEFPGGVRAYVDENGNMRMLAPGEEPPTGSAPTGGTPTSSAPEKRAETTDGTVSFGKMKVTVKDGKIVSHTSPADAEALKQAQSIIKPSKTLGASDPNSPGHSVTRDTPTPQRRHMDASEAGEVSTMLKEHFISGIDNARAYAEMFKVKSPVKFRATSYTKAVDAKTGIATGHFGYFDPISKRIFKSWPELERTNPDKLHKPTKDSLEKFLEHNRIKTPEQARAEDIELKKAAWDEGRTLLKAGKITPEEFDADWYPGAHADTFDYDTILRADGLLPPEPVTKAAAAPGGTGIEVMPASMKEAMEMVIKGDKGALARFLNDQKKQPSAISKEPEARAVKTAADQLSEKRAATKKETKVAEAGPVRTEPPTAKEPVTVVDPTTIGSSTNPAPGYVLAIRRIKGNNAGKDIRVLSARQREEGKGVADLLKNANPDEWEVGIIPEGYRSNGRGAWDAMIPDSDSKISRERLSAGKAVEEARTRIEEPPMSFEDSKTVVIDLSTLAPKYRDALAYFSKSKGAAGGFSHIKMPTSPVVTGINVADFLEVVLAQPLSGQKITLEQFNFMLKSIHSIGWSATREEFSERLTHIANLTELELILAPSGVRQEGMEISKALEYIEDVKGIFSVEEIEDFKKLITSIHQHTGNLPSGILLGEGSGVGGTYEFRSNSIWVSRPPAPTISPTQRVFAHELGHWAYYNVLSAADRLDFMRAAEKYYSHADGDGTYSAVMKNIEPHAISLRRGESDHAAHPVENHSHRITSYGTNEEISPQELFAEQFALYAVRRLAKDGASIGDEGFWKRIVGIMKSVFDRFFYSSTINPEFLPLFQRILPDEAVSGAAKRAMAEMVSPAQMMSIAKTVRGANAAKRLHEIDTYILEPITEASEYSRLISPELTADDSDISPATAERIKEFINSVSMPGGEKGLGIFAGKNKEKVRSSRLRMIPDEIHARLRAAGRIYSKMLGQNHASVAPSEDTAAKELSGNPFDAEEFAADEYFDDAADDAADDWLSQNDPTAGFSAKDDGLTISEFDFKKAAEVWDKGYELNGKTFPALKNTFADIRNILAQHIWTAEGKVIADANVNTKAPVITNKLKPITDGPELEAWKARQERVKKGKKINAAKALHKNSEPIMELPQAERASASAAVEDALIPRTKLSGKFKPQITTKTSRGSFVDFGISASGFGQSPLGSAILSSATHRSRAVMYGMRQIYQRIIEGSKFFEDFSKGKLANATEFNRTHNGALEVGSERHHKFIKTMRNVTAVIVSPPESFKPSAEGFKRIEDSIENAVGKLVRYTNAGSGSKLATITEFKQRVIDFMAGRAKLVDADGRPLPDADDVISAANDVSSFIYDLWGQNPAVGKTLPYLNDYSVEALKLKLEDMSLNSVNTMRVYDWLPEDHPARVKMKARAGIEGPAVPPELAVDVAHGDYKAMSKLGKDNLSAFIGEEFDPSRHTFYRNPTTGFLYKSPMHAAFEDEGVDGTIGTRIKEALLRYDATKRFRDAEVGDPGRDEHYTQVEELEYLLATFGEKSKEIGVEPVVARAFMPFYKNGDNAPSSLAYLLKRLGMSDRDVFAYAARADEGEDVGGLLAESLRELGIKRPVFAVLRDAGFDSTAYINNGAPAGAFHYYPLSGGARPISSFDRDIDFGGLESRATNTIDLAFRDTSEVSEADAIDAMVADGLPRPLAKLMNTMRKKRKPNADEKEALLSFSPLAQISTSANYLRKHGLNWLADFIAPQHGTGHYERVNSEMAKVVMPIVESLNKLPDAGNSFKRWARDLHPKQRSQPKSHLRILDAVRRGGASPEFANLSADEREVAKQIIDAFASAHAKMKELGMNAGNIKNYFPQIWQVNKIQKNKPEFVDRLTSYFMREASDRGEAMNIEDAKAIANRIAMKLTDSDGVYIAPSWGSKEVIGDHIDFQRMIRLEKYPEMLSGLSEYLENDLQAVIVKYFDTFNRRVDFVQKFGHGGHAFNDYKRVALDGVNGVKALLSSRKARAYNFRNMDAAANTDESQWTIEHTDIIPPFKNKDQATPAALEALRIAKEQGARAAADYLYSLSPSPSSAWKARTEAAAAALAEFTAKNLTPSSEVQRFMDGVYNTAQHKRVNPGDLFDHSGNRVSRAIRSFNSLTLLSYTVLTSLSDPVLSLVRSGDFKSWTKGMAKWMSDPQYREGLRNIGVAIENLTHQRMQNLYGQDGTAVANAFFNLTLLTPWTNMQRELSGAVAIEAFKTEQRRAIDNYDPSKPIVEQNRAYKTAARFLKRYGVDHLIREGAATLDSLALDDATREGVIRFANETIFTPNGNDIPLWGQTPWGSVVMQLKSFPLLMGRMSRYTIEEAAKGNPWPLAYLLTMGTGAGYGTMIAHDYVRGRGGDDDRSFDQKDRELTEAMAGAMMQFGGLGLIGGILFDSAEQLDNGAFGSQRILSIIGGPAVGDMISAINIGAGISDDNPSNAKERQAVREAFGRIPFLGGNVALKENVVDSVAGSPTGRSQSKSSGGFGGSGFSDGGGFGSGGF